MPASIFPYLSSRWSNLPIRYKGAVVIAIPCASLLLSLLFFALLNREQQAAAQRTIHTQQVRLETRRLLTAQVDAGPIIALRKRRTRGPAQNRQR